MCGVTYDPGIASADQYLHKMHTSVTVQCSRKSNTQGYENYTESSNKTFVVRHAFPSLHQNQRVNYDKYAIAKTVCIVSQSGYSHKLSLIDEQR